jgi:hypothetical protein
MNDDVLTNIAGFCDIDSRRALGTGPRPVKRNTNFDTRLAAIHGMRADAVTVQQNRDYAHWSILLNDRLSACILQRRPDDRAPFLDYMTVLVHFEGTIQAQYICGMDRLPEHAYSAVIVNDSGGYTNASIRADWVNGKWTVCMDHHRRHLWPLIRQLGYTPVYNR